MSWEEEKERKPTSELPDSVDAVGVPGAKNSALNHHFQRQRAQALTNPLETVNALELRRGYQPLHAHS